MTERLNTNSIDHGTPIWIHNTVRMNSPFPPNSIQISERSRRISRFFDNFPGKRDNNSSQIFRITDISPTCATAQSKHRIAGAYKLVHWTNFQAGNQLSFSRQSWHATSWSPASKFFLNQNLIRVMISGNETGRSWRKPEFAGEYPKLYAKLEGEGWKLGKLA